MVIISHRGFWKTLDEKNTFKAFEYSLMKSFGIETDIRDFNGELVISHDIAGAHAESLDSFFKLYRNLGKNEMLALNIKADGLRLKLKELLRKYSITNYFVFDMSIPEMLLYSREKFIFFTRQSEYESIPALYEEAGGVWMDCFNSCWIKTEDIFNNLNTNKKVCLVSPELHRRDYEEFWSMIKNSGLYKNENLMLCTDYPDRARNYFNG